MVSRDTETRTISLVDIPLLMRLTDKATVLDNHLAYTRHFEVSNGRALTSLLPQQRELYTLVARSDKQQAIGQFRLRGDSPYAHINYVAPALVDHDDRVWLHVLDAMAREAGKHKVHGLIAEVDEADVLFETMRTAGYAVYARQQVWRRGADVRIVMPETVGLSKATEDDEPGIYSLIAHTVPTLVQQIVFPPEETCGWVYRENDKVAAYFAVDEGKNGIYVLPFIHPDVRGEVDVILESLLQQLSDSDRRPIYICIRRYQEWLSSVLEVLGFEPGSHQAVMVKHIKVGVHHANYSLAQTGVLAGCGPIKPPTNHYTISWSVRSQLKKSIWNDGLQTISINSNLSCPVISTRRWTN